MSRVYVMSRLVSGEQRDKKLLKMVENPLDIAADFRHELSKERKLSAELTLKLKELKRNCTHETKQLKNLLEAEKEKSLKLQHLLTDRDFKHKAALEAQLQEALDSNQDLQADLVKLKRFANYEDLENKLQDADVLNCTLRERVKELEREVQEIEREAAKIQQFPTVLEQRGKTSNLSDGSSFVIPIHSHSIDKTKSPSVLKPSQNDAKQMSISLVSQVDKFTIEKWQLTEELQDLKTHYEHQLLNVFQQNLHDTETLKNEADRLHFELKEMADEMIVERQKTAIERERRKQLMEELRSSEAAVESLTFELDATTKSLVCSQQTIEQLESEISQDACYEIDRRCQES